MANQKANFIAILFLSLCSQVLASKEDALGTTWAVLIAGSNGYENYRHQADVCHAYQVLKTGGIKDEHIIVFMYDDIAYNSENPHKGVIINKPHGSNVYAGVPKDYTGEHVTAANILAAILGDERGVTGGSRKVVKSGPNDHIFIFYSDHGAPGLLSMPFGDDLYAKDFIAALKKKHASGTYKSMVIYLEACESGSMFEGLLPRGLNIYATTASNAEESSYATYCPDMGQGVPREYTTCLGDLYSVSWTEDSDRANRQKETLEKQYLVVKSRTINAKEYGSHVMQYGDMSVSMNYLYLYLGARTGRSAIMDDESVPAMAPLVSVEQREADLVHLTYKWHRAPEGSPMKVEAKKKLDEVISHRKLVDESIKAIGQFIFGAENGVYKLHSVRPSGLPLVDDWDCLKTMVATYQQYCGSLNSYGKKYMRAFANICNAGVRKDKMVHALARACP